MEIHQLRYFVEVVRTSSFTRAAQRCNVTQPTLSHQIKKLEDLLGEPLLLRRRNGVQPTALGEIFYKRALTILHEIKAATEEASSYSGELKGSLRLGVIPTIAPYLMPVLLKASLKKFSNLTFEITEDTTDSLLASMRTGLLDASLLSLPVTGEEWGVEELLQDELLIALPAQHPLAKISKSIRPARLAKESMILMKEAHCLRGQSLAICARNGITPNVYFHSSQIDTLLAMVESGFGISFIPAIARPSVAKRKVELRSLSPKPAYRTLALVWPRQNPATRALESFRQACLAVVKKSDSQGL